MSEIAKKRITLTPSSVLNGESPLVLTATLEPFAEFVARCGGNLRDSVRATTRV